MKHLYKFSLFLLALLLPAIAAAHDIEVDGIYYNIYGTEAYVTYKGAYSNSYNEYSGDVTIPLTVTYNGTTYSVTTIGYEAFFDCTGITSVTIGNSVTSINGRAFYGCTGLSSIDIPNSVTTIGGGAFYGCTWLTSITIPNSVKTIYSYTFYGCSGLTSVTIGNSVTSIYGEAFYGCTGLSSIDIPNSVTLIGPEAFGNCSGLTSIVVASGNPKYDSRGNCNAIIETATNTLVVGCKNTNIPNSVTTIGYSAFSGCTGLTSITIPNSVTTIGRYAFGYCTGLASVTIGNSVTSIGEGAFNYFNALDTVKCLGTVPPVMVSRNCFSEAAYNNATLLVPSNSIEAYQTTAHWYEFAHIEGWGSVGPGDVNGDGEVNISDISDIIDVILGGNMLPGADVNGDGEVNITDINAIIDIILR